jgi:hypothetical protein
MTNIIDLLGTIDLAHLDSITMTKVTISPEQTVINFTETKTCYTCKKEKNINLFGIKKANADRHSIKCFDCTKEYSYNYYHKKANRELPKPIIHTSHKTCIKCNENKILAEFNNIKPTKLKPQGLNNRCRDCCYGYQRKTTPKYLIEFPKRKQKVFKKLTHEVIVGERWKSATGEAGRYLVSNKGRVFSVMANKIIPSRLHPKGYLTIKLTKKWFIHRLVLINFKPNPLNKPQCNHIDGVKINNCIENLEWVTNQENQDHAWRTGLMRYSPLYKK